MTNELNEKHFLDLANRAYNRGIYCYSSFLDLQAQNDLKRVRKQLPPVPLNLFGGREGCERVVACFGDPETCGYEPDYPVTCLHATPANKSFAGELTHRDYLGALMGLGIERELLGDIVVRDQEAWIFCLTRIAPYLLESFFQAGRTTLHVTETEAPPAGELFRLKEEVIQVTGERLDAVVAHLFKLSRNDAQSLFTSGKVFVNGAECVKTTMAPSSGDQISVRGFGRFRYGGIVSESRKGKLNIKVDIYV